ncbi:MAG: hypothetical protein ACRDS9_11865 [Pseudonocardiaceae bacterium]
MTTTPDQTGPIEEPLHDATAVRERRTWAVWTVVLLAATLLVLPVMQLGDDRDLVDQEHRIEELRARLAQARTAQDKDHAEAVREALGTDPGRVRGDTRTVRALARTALTWDSGDSYARARESIQRRYGLGPGSQFMTALVPAPAVNRDSRGESYDAIDAAGANCALKKLDVAVIGVVATESNYVAEAVVTVTSNTVEDGETERRVLMKVTLDAAGEVTDASGHIADGPTRESE